MRVTDLWIYPIKSCAGIKVDSFDLDDRGPVDDRRFMLVDEAGEFITAREEHRLVLVHVTFRDGGVEVAAPGTSAFWFRAKNAEETRRARIWDDSVSLQPVSLRADEWFSEFLGRRCRLMHMPRSSERVVDPHYSPSRRLVSLADAFPMLLIGQGSLDGLNARLETPLPMRRFRPNVVVDTTEAHEEDEWRQIQIGDGSYDLVKPCARCVLTTVDPDTGVAGKEPLRTLSTYRKVGSKVLFGQNVIHAEPSTIRVNDPVTVLARA